MTQLSTVCVASIIKNQIIFFDGNDIYFDGHKIHFINHTLSYMEVPYIQPFALKAGNSGNYQPNDNGPNSKLKSLYNH